VRVSARARVRMQPGLDDVDRSECGVRGRRAEPAWLAKLVLGLGGRVRVRAGGRVRVGLGLGLGLGRGRGLGLGLGIGLGLGLGLGLDYGEGRAHRPKRGSRWLSR